MKLLATMKLIATNEGFMSFFLILLTCSAFFCWSTVGFLLLIIAGLVLLFCVWSVCDQKTSDVLEDRLPNQSKHRTERQKECTMDEYIVPIDIPLLYGVNINTTVIGHLLMFQLDVMGVTYIKSTNTLLLAVVGQDEQIKKALHLVAHYINQHDPNYTLCVKEQKILMWRLAMTTDEISQ